MIKLGRSFVSSDSPTYFIADIASNHDGDLTRAIDLIHLAAESGACAAKFQNFKAETIVSGYGFSQLKHLQSHQSKWKDDVISVYRKASIDVGWTPALLEACNKAGIDYLTAPYDINMVEELDQYVCAWKIGSGDISWHQLIAKLSTLTKPILLATGASSIDDVTQAMAIVQSHTEDIVLMQCNTNYTGSIDNLRHVNLRVLQSYEKMFPNIILGLSDHTPGHSTVLGAISLGARVVEKHFTDDTSLEGPDHKFSMDPSSWSEMVQRSRELEAALGDGIKRVQDNEKETHILQRRAVRASCDIKAGTRISEQEISFLRPCPHNGIPPSQVGKVLGRVLSNDIKEGDIITLDNCIVTEQ